MTENVARGGFLPSGEKKKKEREREREEKGQAVLLVRIGLPLVRRVELQKFYSEIAAILH